MTKSKAKEIAALKKKIAAVEAKQAKKKVMPVDAAGNPPSDAALRRMEKAKAKPVDTTNLTPRIEAGYFLQGPVRFAVDTDNLDRTISCGPFGPGQTHEKDGVLLNLGEAELTRWGQMNQFTTKPFVRELLCEVLRGILQDAWFAACYDVVKTPGLLDNPARRAANHAVRVAKYEERLKAAAQESVKRVEKMKASGTLARVRQAAGAGVACHGQTDKEDRGSRQGSAGPHPGVAVPNKAGRNKDRDCRRCG
jgi:hypothetical protein